MTAGVTLDLLDRDGTFIKTLGLYREAGWNHPRRGDGNGAMTVPNDHLDLAAMTGETGAWRIVRCMLDGQPTGFGWLLLRDPSRRLSAEGRHGELTMLSGPGARALLGSGEWGGAVVVANNRNGHWSAGWPTLSYDTSGWTSPVSLGQQGNPTSLLPRLAGQPEGFPDQRAEWLWTRALTQSGGRTFHPPGTCYFHRKLRAAQSGVEGKARIWIAGTTEWEMWWDGEMVLAGGGFRDLQTFDVEFDLADVAWAIKVDKHDHPHFEWDPGAIIGTIARLDAAGEPGERLYSTFTDDGHDGPVPPSPDPWKVLDYEDPTGVNAGQVFGALMDQAQARGALAGIGQGFDGSDDSDGNPWEVYLPVVSYRDGELLGDVALQLSQQFGADLQMWVGTGSPPVEVRIHNRLGTDRSGDVQLADATPAAAAADVDGSAPKATYVRIETDGDYGWAGPEQTPPIGRRETAATYGKAGSLEEVANAAQNLLDELRGVRRQTVTSAGVDGARPYSDYRPGDEVGVVDQDMMQPHRVDNLAVTDLPAGEVDFELDVERHL